MKNPALKYYLIALAVVAVDQVVKLAVKLNMQLGEEHNLVGGLLRLHFIENKGAAFGLTLSDLFHLSEDVAKVSLTLFSVGLVGVIAVYLYHIRWQPTSLPVWIAVILGGAFGNIIDRVFYGAWFAAINDYEGGLFHGRVVDMFYLHFYQGWMPAWVPGIGGSYRTIDFAIFNVADAAISIGIIVILLWQRRFFGSSHPAVKEAAAEAAQASALREALNAGADPQALANAHLPADTADAQQPPDAPQQAAAPTNG